MTTSPRSSQGLNPNLTEYSNKCNSGGLGIAVLYPDGNYYFNLECVQAMYGLCSAAQSRGENALSSPTSNCYLYRIFMETIMQNNIHADSVNRQYLDPLKYQWCNLEKNLESPECACLNATRNSELGGQCASNATTCPGDVDPLAKCMGTSFTKTYKGDMWMGDTLASPDGAAYVNFGFDQCLPYYCWADACWASDVYKTYDAIASQTQGCGNACITIKAENTMTQLDVGSFDHLAPIQTLFPQCDKSSGAPEIYYVPITYKYSVDLPTSYVMNLQCVNINGGQNGFVNLVGSQSGDGGYWLEFPQIVSNPIQVPVGGVRSLTFTLNTLLLRNVYSTKIPIVNANGIPEVYVCDSATQSMCRNLAANRYIKSPSFTFQYTQLTVGADGMQVYRTREVVVYAHMVLWPPSDVVVNDFIPRKSINATNSPTWSRTMLVVCLIIFVVCYVLKEIVSHYALRKLPELIAPPFDL